nr:MAG TPA: hypothetical protein [Caudoviricetes sp.]
MSNVDYKGSVTLISGLTQANNGSFPLVDGDAVQYKQEINEDGTFKSVSQKLSEFNRFYEYATSDDIDGILNGLFGQWKRLSLTEDTMLENTFEDQLKILSVNGNSYQPTSNNVVPTPEKSIPIISKKTNIKRISPNIFDLEKESDTSKITDSGTYRSVGQHQLKPNTKYVFSWSGATVPAKATLSFQIQDDKGTVLVSPFTYFNLESTEKEEAGKEVEFTTNSSGIVKFAYNCTVGTSNTIETYQQYWYTKILKNIALKEDVEYEPEYVELRSLKETGNLFDLKYGQLLFGEKVGSTTNNGSGVIIENQYAGANSLAHVYLKANTNYFFIANRRKELIDGMEESGNDLNLLNIKKNGVPITQINSGKTFTLNESGYYDLSLYGTVGCKVSYTSIMLVEGTSAPSTYIPPTIRDYKIIDHDNKTAKIVRNINQFELPTDFSWNDTDYYPNITGNVIPEDKKGAYDTRRYNLTNYTIEQYFTYINVSGMYLGFRECNTYWKLNNSDEVNAFLTRIKEDGKPFLFQYQLATPVEETITYVETDTSEVGYSWQDTTSPSPTIKSEVRGVEKIDILKTGKNLFDVESAKDIGSWDGGVTYRNFTGIYLKPNTTYTFSVSKNNMYKDYKAEYNGNFAFYIGEKKNAPSPNILIGNSGANIIGINNKYTFTTTDKPIYFNLYVKTWDSENMNIVFEELLQNIQIEVGDTATAYEPYKPLQSLSYQLDTPLKGINNTKDIIDIESNQRTDNLTIFVLDDKTTKSIIVGTTKEKTQVFQLDISDIFNDNDIWCDKLKNDRNKDEELFTYQSGNIYINIDKNRLETIDVAGFKKWLKDNPLTFTGSATTPTQEILPEDLPAELNKLKTNDDSTVIYINGEVKPSLNIEYKGT